MKLAKKIIAVMSAAVITLSFASCAGNVDKPTDDSTAGGAVAAIKKEDLKIGVIHIGDPADGSGYSYAHDTGIVEMQKALGLTDDQIVRKKNVSDTDATQIKTAIEAAIAEKCNVIFATSFGFMDTTAALAEQYPQVIFSHGTGYKSNTTNFNNYFGRIYQARYLAGIAAGLKTKSNKIGYVSAYGTEMAETCSGINAFALGAQSVNPNAVVYVKTLQSWFDPTNETAYAEALLDMGCDVISQHCDTANPQVAAQAAGAYGCGYNSDMTAQAPKAHLTATIWNWGVYYTKAVQAIMDGKFAEFGNYYEGVAEGLCDVSPLSENCVAGTKEKIDAVKVLFKDKSWDVFSGVKLSFNDDSSVVKTDDPLKDNAGNEVVAKGGASVDDGVITGKMNYFVQGVELK